MASGPEPGYLFGADDGEGDVIGIGEICKKLAKLAERFQISQ